MKAKLLDCTIRDGGYVNNWDFPIDFVKKAYNAALNSGVDVFEVGFLSDDMQLPLWRRSPPEEVQSVRTSDKMLISAMLENDTVGMKLELPTKTGIDILRVALNKDKVKGSLPHLKKYRDQGYQIFIQLMGITSYSDIEILNIISEVEAAESVDYINIGDSYGSLLPTETHRIISLMKRNSRLRVGLHPHNNMQMGMANIIAAIDAGADIVDGSMSGMGRGGGNVPMELMLAYFGKLYPNRFNVLPALEFINVNMIKLMQQYEWGYSLAGVLSGVYECHPYYTSRLVEKRQYTIGQILKTVKIVNNREVIGFSDQLLTSIIENGFEENSEELAKTVTKFVQENSRNVLYLDRHKGRNFVVLGGGRTLKNYHKDIIQYIADNDAIVLGANNLDGLFIPNYHAFNNQRRLEQYGENVSTQSRILIGPGIDEPERFAEAEKIIAFNSSVTALKIEDGVVTSNCASISVLLGAVAVAMGASSIAFAGLDGYIGDANSMFYDEERSKHQHDILDMHNQNEKYLRQLITCAKTTNCKEITFITPTTYKTSDM